MTATGIVGAAPPHLRAHRGRQARRAEGLLDRRPPRLRDRLPRRARLHRQERRSRSPPAAGSPGTRRRRAGTGSGARGENAGRWNTWTASVSGVQQFHPNGTAVPVPWTLGPIAVPAGPRHLRHRRVRDRLLGRRASRPPVAVRQRGHDRRRRRRRREPLLRVPVNCLVTGGAGFIGSHLVDALLARGARRDRARRPLDRALGEPRRRAQPRRPAVHGQRRRRRRGRARRRRRATRTSSSTSRRRSTSATRSPTRRATRRSTCSARSRCSRRRAATASRASCWPRPAARSTATPTRSRRPRRRRRGPAPRTPRRRPPPRATSSSTASCTASRR